MNNMDKSQLKINNYFLISPVKKLKWSNPTDLQQRPLSAIRQCNNIAGWATVRTATSHYLKYSGLYLTIPLLT